MKEINTVIFDLDGTLLNTLDDLADSVNYALLQLGMKERSVDEVCSFIGNGVYMLCKRACENADDCTVERLLDIFKQHYEQNSTNKTRPYDGICEMLLRLKQSNIKTAVVSNKFDKAVVQLCEKYFGSLIDTAIGEGGEIKRKPCPDGVFEVMKRLGAMPESAVYIGDSDIDIETAKNAGLPCISVSWGFKTRAQLENFGAERIVDNPEQLLRIIMEQ